MLKWSRVLHYWSSTTSSRQIVGNFALPSAWLHPLNSVLHWKMEFGVPHQRERERERGSTYMWCACAAKIDGSPCKGENGRWFIWSHSQDMLPQVLLWALSSFFGNFMKYCLCCWCFFFQFSQVGNWGWEFQGRFSICWWHVLENCSTFSPNNNKVTTDCPQTKKAVQK